MPDMSKPENQKPPGNEVSSSVLETPAQERTPDPTPEPEPQPREGGAEKKITITLTADEWADLKDVLLELVAKGDEAAR